MAVTLHFTTPHSMPDRHTPPTWKWSLSCLMRSGSSLASCHASHLRAGRPAKQGHAEGQHSKAHGNHRGPRSRSSLHAWAHAGTRAGPWKKRLPVSFLLRSSFLDQAAPGAP